MNEMKIDRCVKVFKVVSLLSVLGAVYDLTTRLGLLETFSRINLGEGMSALWVGMPAVVLRVLVVCIASQFISRDLKLGKGWAWIGGVSLCVFTLASFSLPASIFGLVCLMDKDVREPYLKTFEFKF